VTARRLTHARDARVQNLRDQLRRLRVEFEQLAGDTRIAKDERAWCLHCADLLTIAIKLGARQRSARTFGDRRRSRVRKSDTGLGAHPAAGRAQSTDRRGSRRR
jgi:hypothetical protein